MVIMDTLRQVQIQLPLLVLLKDILIVGHLLMVNKKTLTLEIEPKYIAFTVGGNKQNAVLYDVENQEYIINAAGANIITSVNGKVVTINTWHNASAVNYLNYW